MTTPTVTDEAVEVAAKAYNDAVKTDAFGDVGESQHFDAMQAALEAALPHLAPQPVVDREALIKAFEASASRGETVFGREFVEGWADTFADAVLALLNGGAK